MKKSDFQIVIWQEGKHFVARCLNIEVSSFGETKEEALSNIKEALELCLEDETSTDFSDVNQPEIVSQSLSYA